MGTKPRTQQRPKAFHRVDMHFVKAIAVLVASVFSLAMINGMMVVSPLRQSAIDRVFIRIKRATLGNDAGDDRSDRFLLHILEHVNDHLTAALNETEYGRF